MLKCLCDYYVEHIEQKVCLYCLVLFVNLMQAAVISEEGTSVEEMHA